MSQIDPMSKRCQRYLPSQNKTSVEGLYLERRRHDGFDKYQLAQQIDAHTIEKKLHLNRFTSHQKL